MSSIIQEGLLDRVRLLVCTGKWLVSPTFLPVLSYLQAPFGMPVGFVLCTSAPAQLGLRGGVGPLLLADFLYSLWCDCQARSGGSDVTPGHAV